MNETPKHIEYAVLITDKIAELFQDGTIDIHEMAEHNLTDFIHALANTTPNNFYNKITGDEKNNLEFNHIANQLVFQYSKKDETENS